MISLSSTACVLRVLQDKSELDSVHGRDSLGFLLVQDMAVVPLALLVTVLAGDGGGWAEGYYVNYWTYEWMFFCEAALRCEGIDYFSMSPDFLGNRAVASMFETFPGISEHHSRRPIPR